MSKSRKLNSKRKTEREILEELLERMTELEKKYEKSLEIIGNMKEQMKIKDGIIENLKDKVETLEIDMEQMKQRSRLGNIIIRGIPEKKGEKCLEVVCDIGEKIGVVTPRNDVQVCHRVPSKNKKVPRPIVVRLLNTKTRDLWVANSKKSKIWTKKIYLHEHLTPKNQFLFQETKKFAKNLGYKYVWTKDCKILIRKKEGDRVNLIKSISDLEKLDKKKFYKEELEQNQHEESAFSDISE